MAPPAQPPKSVSQKPLVLNWIAENNISAGKIATPPTTSTHAVPVAADYDLPASATELSNQQVTKLAEVEVVL